jgi:methionyl-tRNA formyltransferase
MKTIFFGTHKFAVTILQGLIDSPLVEVELVITQPDKPVGRKQELQPSPVKILAEKNNIEVNQPKSLKDYELRTKNWELAITAQYGMLIPENIINTPKFGTLNVHTSLLPKYRGASPIQSAIINGEAETGVTIMKMDKGMDTGDIILQKTLKIAPDDTYPTLDEKLAKTGILALLEAIPGLVSGTLQPQPQDNSKATTCHQLTREDGKIDWNKTTDKIYNIYRGLTPWPGIWTMWNDLRLKLLNIKPSSKKLKPGQVDIENDKLYIGTNNSSIEILELQLEGKQKMDRKSFINGYKEIHGKILN